MTTYRVTAPDGSKYNVTGDGTGEEALKHFQDNYTVNRNENYGNEGRSHPEVNADADSGTLQRFGAAVSGATDTLRVNANDFIKKVLPKSNPNQRSLITGQLPPTPSPEAQQASADMQASMDRSRNRSEAYERTKEQLGTAGAVGDVVPELALSAVPIARASSAAAKIPLLAKTLGRYAPAVADIAANATYEGGKKAASNYTHDRDLLEGVDDAALTGAGGAAAGRVLVRALGGLKPLASKSAQTLIDRGVIPTPGQSFDGPIGNFLRNTEDRLTGLPVVGDVIQYARKRSVADYGRTEVNDALRPVLSSTKASPVGATGSEAVEEAQRKVSSVYDEALDGMQVTPKHINDGLRMVQPDIHDIALLDDAQLGKLNDYVNLRIAPHMQGGAMDGQTAKALDSEIGHYARKYSRSINPEDHPLGEAFYSLQTGWREAMAQGATPDKIRLLDAANAAHKNLLPIVKASEKAMAQQGVFTPNQLQRSYGPFAQGQSRLNKAAQEVLPSRVPDSGTAGRYLLGAALGGGAAISGPAAGATLAASILYTRAGSHILLNGLSGFVPKASIDYLRKLAPDALVNELARMHGKYKHIREPIANAVRQAAAQGGRMQATQPEEELQQ